MDLDFDKLQKKVAQCIKTDCPSANACLRQLIRTKCSKDIEQITVINPDAIVMDKEVCQFFKSTEGTSFGKGFDGYFDTLKVPQARTARSLLLGYFNNRAQLHRYRTGTMLLSPERIDEINALLAHHQLPPLVLDEIVVDIL